MITNEICNLVDFVTELTLKIEVTVDSNTSQTIFNMFEIKYILAGEKHKIRALDQTYHSDKVLKERMRVDDLKNETLKVREISR